jgi:hypothetical protein
VQAAVGVNQTFVYMRVKNVAAIMVGSTMNLLMFGEKNGLFDSKCQSVDFSEGGLNLLFKF